MQNRINLLAVAFAAILLCGSANASAWITFPVSTYHKDRLRRDGESWNENQHKNGPAFGFEFGQDRGGPSIVTGRYQNSFNKASVYVGVKYEPLQVGPVGIGLIAGLATGYDRPFIGGLTTSITSKNGSGLVAIWAPSSGAKASSFVSVQARLFIH